MKDVALDVLTFDLRQHPPETKYLLIGLANLYDHNQTSAYKVRNLADELAIPDSVVTAGLPTLENSQLITIDTETADDGESSRTLTVAIGKANIYARSTGAKQRQSGTPKILPCCHSALIENLLLATRRKKHRENGHVMTKPKANPKINEAAENLSQLPGPLQHSTSHNLTVSNRLTLMVLLRYADACGVVRDLGLTDLEILTGTKQDKLAGQLEKLKQAGYIRASYSGISNRAMFGPATGGYFLNLSHPSFGEQAKPSITVTYRKTDVVQDEFSLAPNEAIALLNAVNQLGNTNLTALHAEMASGLNTSDISPWEMRRTVPGTLSYRFTKPETDFTAQIANPAKFPISSRLIEFQKDRCCNVPLSLDYWQVTQFFETRNKTAFCEFLQVKLDQLVALFMTDFWIEIFNDDLRLTDNIKTIIKDLFLSSRKSQSHPDCESAESQGNLDALLALIFETAIMATKRLQGALACIDIIQEDMAFTILPAKITNIAQTQMVRTIQMFHKPHSNGHESQHYHLEHSRNGTLNLRKLSVEEFNTQNYQWEYGLSCKPRKKYDLSWKSSKKNIL